MKNIFTLLNLSNMKDQVQSTCSRFPITVIFALIISGILFGLIHGDFSQVLEDNLIRGVLGGIIGFIFSLGFYLFGESYNYSKLKNNILQIVPIIYSSLFFVFFQNIFNSLEEIIFFILSLVGIIGFLYFAPYVKNILNNTGKQTVYYSYFYKISVILLISHILGGILFGLGAIGITAVHTLFDLNGYFTDEIYGDWAVIALSIITPLFMLSKIPKKNDFNNNNFTENVFFSFLVKYIAIPFIYIYFIILYAYSAKVLLNFGDWPKGEVSWMVIGFSTFGYLIYIFSYIFEEKNNFIKTFRKYFPIAVVPQIFMLFYAIYLRINQYDITVNRYFIVVFGIWLLFISLYYIISRKKFIGNILVILTLFTVIISVGPWSVYQLPEARQLERLERNLIEANILQDDTIIPLKNYKLINADLSSEIYDGIDYLCDFSNCEEIKELFPEITQKVIDDNEIHRLKNIELYPDDEYYQKIQEPNKWELVNGITEIINVKRKYNYEYINRILYITTDDIFPINTQDSQNLYRINISNYSKDTQGYYNKLTDTLTVKSNDKTITVIALDEIKENMISHYNKTGKTKFNSENMYFDITNAYGDFRLYIISFNLENPEYISEDNDDDEYDDFSINAYLLER